MSLTNSFTRSLLVAMVGAMTLAAPQTAIANEVAHDTVPVATNGVAEITGTALMSDAIKMKRSRFPRTELTENGVRYLVYSLDDGRIIGLPDPDQPTHLVNAGFRPGNRGSWVELTPLEQKIIANGGAAGVAGAICAASAGAACVVAGVAAAVIATYVSDKGVCPNEARLVTYHDWRGRIQSAECR